MNRSPFANLQPPAQKTGKNWGGALALLVFVVLMGLLLLWFVTTYFFQGTPLPSLDISLTLGLFPFILVGVLIANLVITYLLYIFARRFELDFVMWLDKRLMPRIRGKRDRPEPEVKMPRYFWLGDPDLVNAPESFKKLQYGTIRTEWGERILGGIPFFPSWHDWTAWPHFWRMAKVVTLTTLTVATLLTVSMSPVMVLITLSILILPNIYYGILRYWAAEWVRYSEFFILTSHRYILADADFSWWGLLTRRGFDVNINWNPITNQHNVDQKSTPKKFGLPLSKWRETFLERWSDSASKVGSIMILTIVGQKSEEFLRSYDFATTIAQLFQQAKGISAQINADMSEIMKEKKRYVRGTPKDSPADKPKRIKTADEWALREIMEAGYQPPSEFDIFAFREGHLKQLAIKKQAIRTPPTSTVAAPDHAMVAQSLNRPLPGRPVTSSSTTSPATEEETSAPTRPEDSDDEEDQTTYPPAPIA